MTDQVKAAAGELEQAAKAEVTAAVPQLEAKVTSFVAKHDFYFLGGAFILGLVVGHVL